ncbi:hypothetical protein STANM309S_00891 [Streptomyces tanashiensis]
MPQHVDHAAVRVADEEAADAPGFVGRGWTISASVARTASYAASTSSTSMLRSGTTGAVRSADIRLTWAVGTDGEASVVIQPWFMTSSKPSSP